MPTVSRPTTFVLFILAIESLVFCVLPWLHLCIVGISFFFVVMENFSFVTIPT